MSGVGAADTQIRHAAQIFGAIYSLVIGLFYVFIVAIFVSMIVQNENLFT